MNPVLRGLASNGVAATLLYAVARAGQLELYAVVALSIQWAVFFLHGLPRRSEVRGSELDRLHLSTGNVEMKNTLTSMEGFSRTSG